jgi:hypothetical protein
LCVVGAKLTGNSPFLSIIEEDGLRDFLAILAECLWTLSTIAMMIHVSLFVIARASLLSAIWWLIPIAAGAIFANLFRPVEKANAWSVR